eukprot:7063961-Prymnesium_polylepis.1
MLKRRAAEEERAARAANERAAAAEEQAARATAQLEAMRQAEAGGQGGERMSPPEVMQDIIALLSEAEEVHPIFRRLVPDLRT